MGDIYKDSRNHHIMIQTQEEVKQILLQKGNTRFIKNIACKAHSGCGTDNQSPIWSEELSFQEQNRLLSKWPVPRPWPTLSSIFLVLEKELHSFPIPQSHKECHRCLDWIQALPGPSKHISGLRKSYAMFLVHVWGSQGKALLDQTNPQFKNIYF